MDEETLDKLKADFEEWSGGFAPESEHQIMVYVDYTLQAGFDPATARRALLDWMEAGDLR